MNCHSLQPHDEINRIYFNIIHEILPSNTAFSCEHCKFTETGNSG